MKKTDPAYRDRVRKMNKMLLGETSRYIAEEDTEYQQFFRGALDKYGVSSPDELDDDKRDEFYNHVDKNWDAGENETDVDESSQLGGPKSGSRSAPKKMGSRPKSWPKKSKTESDDMDGDDEALREAIRALIQQEMQGDDEELEEASSESMGYRVYWKSATGKEGALTVKASSESAARKKAYAAVNKKRGAQLMRISDMSANKDVPLKEAKATQRDKDIGGAPGRGINESIADEDFAKSEELASELAYLFEKLEKFSKEVDSQMSSFNAPGFHAMMKNAFLVGFKRQSSAFNRMAAIKILESYMQRRG